MSYTNTGNAVFEGTLVTPVCGNWNVRLMFTGMATGKFGGNTILGQDIAGVSYDGVIKILHGNGNGGFSFDCEEDEYSLGGGGPPENLMLSDIDVGSFNGGTKADLVVSDSDGAVHLFMGKGDGTFKYLHGNPLYVLQTIGRYPSRVIAVDLDQNGFDDIVVVNHDGNDPGKGSFNVFLNKLVAMTP